uniref:Uncharacterized protein n=2 Tax=viral metagenome TaxID=1070528 RepID=A0A6M3KHN6_9ZZZZ
MLRKILSIGILACFLLSPIRAFADPNPRLIGYPPNTIMGFLGLDTESSAPMIPDGRSPDLQNVKLSGSLDLRKRYGWDPVNLTLDTPRTNSPAVTGIYDAHFSDGTNKNIVFVGDEIYYDNSATWTAIGDYWVAPTITSGANYQMKCVLALDYAVCTNDYDVPLKISTTPAKSTLDTSDLSDAITKVKSLIWYKNYLILGNIVEGGTERPTRFRWSNVGTIETWSDENYIDIASLGGDEIIDFAELYGDLYVFLKNSIYVVSYVGSTDTFVVNKMIENIGAISRDSLQVITLQDKRRAVIFLDDDKKIYLFDGATLIDIGARMQSLLDDLNASRLQYSVGVFDSESYWICASDSSATENNICFEFQTELGEWVKHTDINANAMGRVKISTSDIRTYYGNYDAYVYWLDNPDYDSDGGDGVGYTGVVEYTYLVNTATMTGAQVLVDSTPGFGTDALTGCIVKITSGTGVGEEQVVIYNTSTGIAVASSFSVPIDSTSNYSVGAIDAYYKTRWFDFGSASSRKGFRKMYFWAEEASSNEVDISFSEDFSSALGTTTKNLAPSSGTTWDSAIWDEGIWGTTGDKFYDVLLKGRARTIQFKFENDDVNETFHLYGYHILADDLGVE